MHSGFNTNFAPPSLTALVGAAFQGTPERTRRFSPEQVASGPEPGLLSPVDQVTLERAKAVVGLVDARMAAARELDQTGKDRDPVAGKVDHQVLQLQRTAEGPSVVYGQCQADLTPGSESLLLHTVEVKETESLSRDLYFKHRSDGHKVYGAYLPEVGRVELRSEPNGTLFVHW